MVGGGEIERGLPREGGTYKFRLLGQSLGRISKAPKGGKRFYPAVEDGIGAFLGVVLPRGEFRYGGAKNLPAPLWFASGGDFFTGVTESLILSGAPEIGEEKKGGTLSIGKKKPKTCPGRRPRQSSSGTKLGGRSYRLEDRREWKNEGKMAYSPGSGKFPGACTGDGDYPRTEGRRPFRSGSYWKRKRTNRSLKKPEKCD